MREVTLLVADTGPTRIPGGEWLILGGAVLTLLGAIAGLVRFLPALKGTPSERGFEAASTAALGLGATAGLYGVFYSAAYDGELVFWGVPGLLAAVVVLLGVGVFFVRRSHQDQVDDGATVNGLAATPAPVPVVSPASPAPVTSTEDESEEHKSAGHPSNSEDGDGHVEEGREHHAADRRSEDGAGIGFSSPSIRAQEPARTSVDERRAAAFGALGGALAATVLLAVFRRRR